MLINEDLGTAVHYSYVEGLLQSYEMNIDNQMRWIYYW